MGYVESAESKLKVFSLNTGLSGRQDFTDPDPSRPPSWRFQRILDRIRSERPDVVLLQEVYEEDLEEYSNALGGRMVFSRYCKLTETDREDDALSWGIAIGTTGELFSFSEEFYDELP